jgi:hypothetical protein
VILAVLVALGPGAAYCQSKDAELARIKREPTCPQVQKAALSYFKINREAVEEFRSGASNKAALPVVEVSGGYIRSDLDETTDSVDYGGQWLTKAAGGRGWETQGKLTWNLPQLAFNAEELDVASLAGLVQTVLKEVTRLYYMRRRLQLDLVLNPPDDEGTRLSKELRLEEMTALLDAMTGGYFVQELTRRGVTSSVAGETPEHPESPF